MKADGRLDALLRGLHQPKQEAPLKNCKNCNELAKPMRVGRCTNCAMYFYRHKTERPPERFGDHYIAEPKGYKLKKS